MLSNQMRLYWMRAATNPAWLMCLWERKCGKSRDWNGACSSQGMSADPEARGHRGILGCGSQPSIAVTNCLREQEKTSLGSPSGFSVHGGQSHYLETQGMVRASQRTHVAEGKCSNIGNHRAEQEEGWAVLFTACPQWHTSSSEASLPPLTWICSFLNCESFSKLHILSTLLCHPERTNIRICFCFWGNFIYNSHRVKVSRAAIRATGPTIDCSACKTNFWHWIMGRGERRKWVLLLGYSAKVYRESDPNTLAGNLSVISQSLNRLPSVNPHKCHDTSRDLSHQGTAWKNPRPACRRVHFSSQPY